jgi:hypothetical protein
MSAHIVVHNGGEAPHAARGAGGGAAGGDQGDLMNQDGGQAPDAATGGQHAPASSGPSQQSAGDDIGAPPLGGVVSAG